MRHWIFPTALLNFSFLFLFGCAKFLERKVPQNEIRGVVIREASPVRNASLTVLALNPDSSYGEVLGTGTTGDDGSYVVNVKQVSSPIVIVVGTTPSYEATSREGFTSSDPLTIVLPSSSPTMSANLSELTTFTHHLFLALHSKGDGAEILKEINQLVQNLFGLSGRPGEMAPDEHRAAWLVIQNFANAVELSPSSVFSSLESYVKQSFGEISSQATTPMSQYLLEIEKKSARFRAVGLEISTQEDESVKGNFKATGLAFRKVKYSIVRHPSKGSVTITNESTGEFLFTPDPNKHGSDSFNFILTDGESESNVGVVSVDITPANDRPAGDSQFVTCDEDISKSIILSATDIDNDQLVFRIEDEPSHGTLTGSAPNLTYVPDANYFGIDSFTFVVSDGALSSTKAMVFVTVRPINDTPTANAQTIALNEDSPKEIALTGNDMENGNLVFEIVTHPQHGDLNGTVPHLIYTPEPNYNGSDSFTFKANDGSLDSSPVTISITVNAVDDLPLAGAQSITTREDTAKPITLSGSDIDNNPITFERTSEPAHGVLSGISPNLIYTPNPNFHGSDSFTFKAKGGTAYSSEATITIAVTSENDPPVANGLSISTVEDSAAAVTLSASDVEGDDLAYMIVAEPQKGSLSGIPPNLTYTPQQNRNGQDTFSFQVSDGTSWSSPAIVIVGIRPVNDAPEIAAHRFTAASGKTIKGRIPAIDPEGDSLAFSIRGDGTQGQVTLDDSATGDFTYVAKVQAYGLDRIPMRVTDGDLSHDFDLLIDTVHISFFGGDRGATAMDVAIDAQGNRIMVGSTSGSFEGLPSKGWYDAFVLKVDPRGTVLWKKQLGGNSDDSATAVAVDSESRVIVVGQALNVFEGESTKGSTDVFVVKFDADGTLLWKKLLGGEHVDRANGVAVDRSGSIVVTGSTHANFEGLNPRGLQDAFVVKLAPDGTIEWKKQLGGPQADSAEAVSIDTSGNIALVGTTYGSFEEERHLGNSDVFVVKLDAAGNISWKKQVGGAGQDRALAASTDTSGNIFLTGGARGSFEGEQHIAEEDIFITKLSAIGTIVWKRQMGGVSSESGHAICTDSSGNAYLAGEVWGEDPGTGLGKRDALVMKFDSLGNLQWRKQLGGTSYEIALGVAMDSLGNLSIVGWTDGTSFEGMTPRGPADAFLLKMLP